jgi:hypothetical protein
MDKPTLDLLWEEINAIGGVHDRDEFTRGYNAAVSDMLDTIEKYGGEDPIAARCAFREAAE